MSLDRRLAQLEQVIGADVADAAPVLHEYADDPVGFARDVLGLTLWSHQRRALEAIAKNRRTAWRSSHGVGKTQTVAVAIAWFVATHEDSLVIVTAPSHRQVRSVVWRTLASVLRRARQPLGGELYDSPEHGWRFPDGRAVYGFSAGDAERFAGFHAKNLLAIVDEASGVESEIFEALKGALTGESRLFLVGNPTRTSGEFFAAFNGKAALYHPLHTSALDVPNISGGEPAIPGLIDRAWLDEMAEDYGTESAIYAVRAMGEFPVQSADAVISLALVDAAKERWLEIMRDGGRTFVTLGPLEVGVDPARFGDDETVIVCRRGTVALPPVVMRGADVVSVARRVLEVVTEQRHGDERPTVRVDTVGVGGGVADLLRWNKTINVVDVNAGAGARSETYQRCRDELWFTLRDWLRSGGAIPADPKLEGELVAPTFSYSPAQKIVVEPKDETKKRIKRSPDRADALALAVYAPAKVATVVPTVITRGPFARRIDTSPTDAWGRRLSA